MAKGKKRVEVLYDGQCPVCTSYCTTLKPADDKTELLLVDAREKGKLLEAVTAQGLDIDEGMVVRVDGGEIHYGADAVRALHKHIKPNIAERLLFRSRRVGNVTYRVAKGGRNILLRLLGIGKIENLKS